MKTRTVSLLVVMSAFLLIRAVNVCGQTTAKNQLDNKLKLLAGEIKKARTEQQKKEAFDIVSAPDTWGLAMALRKSTTFVIAAEEARLDKQVGGGAGNAGGTSLTMKGSTPAILGFAVENGALATEQEGTTITFRGNPVGIIKALNKQGFIQSYRSDDASTRFLRRLSFAFSFDASRDPGAGGAFTGSRQQLSSYSLRFDLLNKRDPRDRAYDQKWDFLLGGTVQEFTSSLQPVRKYFDEDAAFVEWHKKAEAEMLTWRDEEVETKLAEKMNELTTLQLSPEREDAIQSFLTKYSSYLTGRDNILEAVAKGAIVTFEYINQRQVDKPDLSCFTLIAETGAFNGKADLTANASVTVFNEKIAGSDRLRDFQLSGQLDVPLGDTLKIGNFVLSFSGRYEHMASDTIIGNGMIAATKGDIGIGQLKLTVPVKGSGIKIPLSVTFSNRTELIKEKQVRANFGITFDLDSIFARFKP